MPSHKFPRANWELSLQARQPIRYDPTPEAEERHPLETTSSNNHHKLDDELNKRHMPVRSGENAFANTPTIASPIGKCYSIERIGSPPSVFSAHPGLAGYSLDKNPREFEAQSNGNFTHVSNETVKVPDHVHVGYDASVSDKDLRTMHGHQVLLSVGQVPDAITASEDSAVEADIFVSMKDGPFSDPARTVQSENEIFPQIRNPVGPATSLKSTSCATMSQCASQQAEVIQNGGQWAAARHKVFIGEDILPVSAELNGGSKTQEITHEAPTRAMTLASGCAVPGYDDVDNNEEIRATNSGQKESRHRGSLPESTGANQCQNHLQQTGACKDHIHATEPVIINSTAVDGSIAGAAEFPNYVLASGPSKKSTDNIERGRRNPTLAPSGEVIPSKSLRPTRKRANQGCHEIRGIASSSAGNIDDIGDDDHNYHHTKQRVKRTKTTGSSSEEPHSKFLQVSDMMCNEHNPDIEDQSDEYEVGKILDARLKGGILQYLIHWPGYGEDHTWYNASNCRNCPDKLDEFHKANLEKPGPPRRLEVWKECWDEDKIAKPHHDDDKPKKYPARRGSRKSKNLRQAP